MTRPVPLVRPARMTKRRMRRALASNKRLLDTVIELRLDGHPLIGPIKLESLALSIRYGGYSAGDDLIDATFTEPIGRVEFLVTPGGD